MKTTDALCVVLASLVVTSMATAQAPPGRGAAANPAAVASAAQRALQQDGSRAGDESLTCDQIGQEMQAFMMGEEMTGMTSAAQRANEEVNRATRVAETRQKTEGPAIQAAAMAEARAAVAMATNPVSAAPQAIAAKRRMEALTQMQIARAQTDGLAAKAATQQYKDVTAGLVMGNVDQMARMRSLSELAQRKNCMPPRGADSPQGAGGSCPPSETPSGRVHGEDCVSPPGMEIDPEFEPSGGD